MNRRAMAASPRSASPFGETNDPDNPGTCWTLNNRMDDGPAFSLSPQDQQPMVPVAPASIRDGTTALRPPKSARIEPGVFAVPAPCNRLGA